MATVKPPINLVWSLCLSACVQNEEDKQAKLAKQIIHACSTLSMERLSLSPWKKNFAWFYEASTRDSRGTDYKNMHGMEKIKDGWNEKLAGGV